MPKEVHNRLVREANKKGLTGERKNAYVYGTLNRIEKGMARNNGRNANKQTRKKKDRRAR